MATYLSHIPQACEFFPTAKHNYFASTAITVRSKNDTPIGLLHSPSAWWHLPFLLLRLRSGYQQHLEAVSVRTYLQNSRPSRFPNLESSSLQLSGFSPSFEPYVLSIVNFTQSLLTNRDIAICFSFLLSPY